MDIKNTLKYMTHIPLLCACINNTKGSILELGMGLGSTPILNATSFTERKVVSVDTNKEWTEPFLKFKSDFHDIKYVNDWENLIEYNQTWDLVIIDQAPSNMRKYSINKLRSNTNIILVHDSSKIKVGRFLFRHDFTKFYPNTCAVSDTNDLKFLGKYKWD